MEQSNIIAFLVGLLIGASVVWLVLRERLARVNADAQVDLARLNERLSAVQAEVARQLAARADAESTLQKLEQDMGDLREKTGAAESTVASQGA